jgi:hypothetical protein
MGRVALELTEVTTLWVDLDEVTSMADVAVVDEFSTIGRVSGAAYRPPAPLQRSGHYLRRLPSLDDRTLCRARPEPFYGQGDLVEIGPLSSSQAVEKIFDFAFIDADKTGYAA